MSYDYQIAKTVLSDKDKDRLLCIYLNRRADGNVRTNPLFTPNSLLITLQIDWEKATTDFQCASVSSMKTMYYGLLKKIENAGGKTGVSASASATPKKSGGKKRKAAPADDDDDDEEATPAVKKKGTKNKKEAEAAADCELCFYLLRQWLRLTCLQLLLPTMLPSRASSLTRARRTLLLGSSHLDDERHTSD